MIELSNERLEQMLHEEMPKREETSVILRAVYIRYMRLYEKYLKDIDALNDAMIEEMREYQEETDSLVKYYYMDIPADVVSCLYEFEEQYGSKLLGRDWHDYVFDNYEEFKRNNRNIPEEDMKAEYRKKTLEAFYEAMNYVFRQGFGTGSQTVRSVVGGITGLLFGK